MIDFIVTTIISGASVYSGPGLAKVARPHQENHEKNNSKLMNQQGVPLYSGECDVINVEGHARY